MSTKLSRHGYVISLDNASGVPVDISSTCGTCEIDMEKATGTLFVANSRFRQVVDGGGLSCTVTLTVYRTSASNEAYRLLNDWYLENNPGSRTLTIDHPTTGAGNMRLTGEFALQSFQLARREPGSGDPETLQAVLVSDGSYTHSVI